MEAYAAAHLGEVSINGHPFAPFGADALTVNGYLGSDGILPLLEICRQQDTGIFVLVKTSNPSSGEVQDQQIGGRSVYRMMGDLCERWGCDLPGNHGYSGVGAVLELPIRISWRNCAQRCHIPFFLVPGYGAQGGSAQGVRPAFDQNGLGAIINSSRALMCAWQKEAVKKVTMPMRRGGKPSACRMKLQPVFRLFRSDKSSGAVLKAELFLPL